MADEGPMIGPAPARRRWALVVRWLRLALVLAMLAGLVIVAKPHRLWVVLAGAQYLWVLPAVPAFFLMALCDSLRLYALMLPHGYRQGWWAMVRTNLVVNFVSQFLPGTVGGGVVAWYRLAQPDKLHAQTFTALLLNTVLKFAAICLVGAAALAADVRTSAEHGRLAAPLLVLGMLPLAGLVLMLGSGLAHTLNSFHARRLEPRLPAWLGGGIRKVLESFETYRGRPGIVILGLLATAARILLGALVVLLCFRAVAVVNVSFMRLLWIMGAVEIVGMIPLSLSGLGLPQVTFVGLLAALGIAEDRSVANAVLAFAAALPVLLAGAAVLVREALARREA